MGNCDRRWGFGASYDELSRAQLRAAKLNGAMHLANACFRSVSAVSLWIEKFGCEFRGRAPR